MTARKRGSYTSRSARIAPDTFYRTKELERRVGKKLSRLLVLRTRKVVRGLYRGAEIQQAYEALLAESENGNHTRH